jgi:hypothetical protein
MTAWLPGALKGREDGAGLEGGMVVVGLVGLT